MQKLGIDMATDEERSATRKFLDANILGFDEVMKHKELRDLTVWCEAHFINGEALHIIIEDGNYADTNVEFCLKLIESGEWEGYTEEYPERQNDKIKMLRVLELMRPLSEEQREMVMEGKTITEDLHDILYNKALD